MSEELKWAMAITLAGVVCVVLAQFDVLPHDGFQYYGTVLIVGIVGLLHVAYQRYRDE